MSETTKKNNNREFNDDFGLITNSMQADDVAVMKQDDMAVMKQKQMEGKSKVYQWIMGGTENAWVRLVIYCLAALLTSCLYFGWQDYSKMLIWSGAYAWKCGPEDIGNLSDPEDPALCDAQSTAVSGLYAFANGSEFVCAAVAGLLLDTIGPRFTAMLGESLQLLAVLFLSFSGHKFQMYIPGLVLTGASVNIICFPALTVMEAWPNHQALAISIIVGCQSSASIIAPIMRSLWQKHPTWTYRGIWLTWVACLWLPITLLYIWALPRRRNFASLVTAAPEPVAAAETLAAPEAVAVTVEPAVVAETECTAVVAEPGTSRDSTGAESIDISASSSVVVAGAPKSNKELWKRFGRDVLTLDMWLMAIFFALLMFEFAYYPAVVRDAVSSKVSDFVGWLTPLQGPFSFVIGFFMDYTGTVWIMCGMCATLIFVNLSCALGADNYALMKGVGFIFTFVQSATYNVKYTFVNETYDPFNFGKLVGVLGICGGVGVYISSPVTQSTHFKRNFEILTGLVAAMMVSTVWIYVRATFLRINHKTVAGVSQTNRINKKEEV